MVKGSEAIKIEERLWTKDFILITLISLFAFLSFQMLLPTLPVYAKDLGGSDTHAGLVIGIFTFSAVLIRPFTGYALDAYGRKGLFFIGLLIFGLSVFSYSLVPSLLMLLLVRFIHGFGWGLTSTSASTVAADIIPKSRMGEGMGYYGLAGTLSMAIAPALGLFIISKFDFKILFLLATCMIVIAILLAFSVKYHNVSMTRRPFSLIEKAALRPTIVIFFLTMTYGAIVSFLALYSAQLGITNIGLFFTVYALSLAVSRPFAGRMSDKIGFNVVVIPGIFFIMLAMYILYNAVNIQWFLLAGIIYGIGFGAAQPSLQALAIVSTPPERRGGANATFFTGFDLGIGISSIMWGVIAEAIGYSLMYLCAIIPALAGLVFYLVTTFNKPREGLDY